jgi:hypothetical protein
MLCPCIRAEKSQSDIRHRHAARPNADYCATLQARQESGRLLSCFRVESFWIAVSTDELAANSNDDSLDSGNHASQQTFKIGVGLLTQCAEISHATLFAASVP